MVRYLAYWCYVNSWRAGLGSAGTSWSCLACCAVLWETDRQADRLTNWGLHFSISHWSPVHSALLHSGTCYRACPADCPALLCSALCLFSFLIVSFLATSSIKLNLNLNLISLRPPTRCGNWIREKFRSAGIAYRKISKTCWRDFLKSLQFQLWA